jgi:hypothetical protein
VSLKLKSERAARSIFISDEKDGSVSTNRISFKESTSVTFPERSGLATIMFSSSNNEIELNAEFDTSEAVIKASTCPSVNRDIADLSGDIRI